MKKNFLIILCLLLNIHMFAYEFYCTAKPNAKIVHEQYDVKTTNRYSNQKLLISTDEYKSGYSIYFLIKNSNPPTYIDIKSLNLPGSNYFKALTNKRNWILEPCLQALYKKNPSLVFPYTGDIKKIVEEYNDELDFPDSPWETYTGPVVVMFDEDRYFGIHVTEINSSPFTGCTMYVLDIDDSYITFYAWLIDDPYGFNRLNGIKLNELNSNTVYKFSYKIDGDYLYLYLNNDLFITFVNIADKAKYEETLKTYKRFITEKEYSLDNITWPHHADGTSEYEDTIRYPDPLVIEEPEQIEIEEYDNSSELADSSSAPAENLDRPPFPDKKDPDYWKILEKYYPDEYPKLRFEYLQKRTKIINTVVIPCAIVFGIILLVVLVLVIRKKRAK